MFSQNPFTALGGDPGVSGALRGPLGRPPGPLLRAPGVPRAFPRQLPGSTLRLRGARGDLPVGPWRSRGLPGVSPVHIEKTLENITYSVLHGRVPSFRGSSGLPGWLLVGPWGVLGVPREILGGAWGIPWIPGVVLGVYGGVLGDDWGPSGALRTVSMCKIQGKAMVF